MTEALNKQAKENTISDTSQVLLDGQGKTSLGGLGIYLLIGPIQCAF